MKNRDTWNSLVKSNTEPPISAERAIEVLQVNVDEEIDSGICIPSDHYVQALQQGVTAINKQIPRTVNCGEFTDISDAECPNCGNDCLYERKYCGECGQALDWDLEEQV